MKIETEIKLNGTKKPKKKNNARKQTAETISRVLAFLHQQGAFAKRINVIGVPIRGEGGVVGFRPSTMAGFPDILGILKPDGRAIGIEVKTGKDRLRPEQEGTHAHLRKVGALVMVVKDFDDFIAQWTKIMYN